MKNIFLCCFLSMFVFSSGFSQDIDSLKKVSSSPNLPDTSRLDALIQLTKYLAADSPKEALSFGEKGVELADKIGDEKRKAWALNYLGSLYFYASNYDSSLFYHQQALEIRLRINDPKGLGASYNNIGQIYDDQGKSKEALDYYLKAVKYFDQANFQLGTAIAYTSIGNLYYYQHDWDNAFTYFSKGLEINKLLGNQRAIMSSYNNLALVYEEKGDTNKAIELDLKAIAIARTEEFTSSLMVGLNNLGEIYFGKNNLPMAMKLFRQSIQICDSIGEESKKISPVANLGNCFIKLNMPDSAIVYGKEGLRLARKTGFMHAVMECYEILANAYKKKNDFETAYDYRINFEQARDSVFSQDKSDQLAEMQTRFDTEKIKKENELQNEKLKLQSAEKKYIIGGAALVAIAAFFILLAWRRTRKMNALLNVQKIEILEKNHDLGIKNNLIEEQKQEITDSIEYARNIQLAMLPSSDEVKEVLQEHFIFFQPRDIVSGDFYFVASRENHSLVAAADCTGHGVPGALMSMIGMEELYDAALRYSAPGEMLSHLNRSVKASLRQDGEAGSSRDGMDIALCSIDRENLNLFFAGANRPLCIVRNGQLEEFKSDKTAIGGFTPGNHAFTSQKIKIEKGDMIYIFSDGYADQFGGPEGKKFMSRKFRDLLIQISDQEIDIQKKIVQEKFQNWKSNLEQVDDVLVIGIRI